MAEAILADFILSSWRSSGSQSSWRAGNAAFAGAASRLGLLTAASLKGPSADALAELAGRAHALACNQTPGLKHAGLQALSVLAAEGDRATFLHGYSEWAGEAAAALKPSGDQQPKEVQRAAWKLLHAVFTRLGKLLEVQSVKREGATLVPRLVSLAAQHAERAGGLSFASLRALLAALTALPSAFRQHTKLLEPLIAGAMMQPPGAVSAGARKLAVACFAALPRAAGDAEAWSASAQTLLVTAHALVDAAYLGLDSPELAATCKQQLDPQAVPLPHSTPTPTASKAPSSMEAYVAAFSQLHAVLDCLHLLLTRSFPAPVPVPTAGLLLLATRLLAVDDAVALSRPAASGGRLAHLCLHLPQLHCTALSLLRTLLHCAGSQVTPFLGAAVRLVADHMGRAAAGGAGALVPAGADTRNALYRTATTLVQVGGMGTARQLAPAVLECAGAELYGQVQGQEGGGRVVDAPARKKSKKARRAEDDAAAAAGLLGGGNDSMGAASEAREIEVQASLLALLEAVLLAGAALLPPAERTRADAIAAHAAVTAAAAAGRLARSSDGDCVGVKPLQLAAYRTLLTSVLAPVGHRPTHLPTALRLFRQGTTDAAPALAQFCSHALLSCEALMHPRAAPRTVPLREAPAEAPPALGMPRFWTAYDGGLALQQQAVQLQERQVQLQAQQLQAQQDDAVEEEAEETAVTAEADAELVQGGAELNPSKRKRSEEEAPSAAAPEAKVARPSAKAELQQTAPSAPGAMLSKAPVAAVPLPSQEVPRKRAVAPPKPQFPHAEEGDSDGSLPDIDSGASSDASESDE